MASIRLIDFDALMDAIVGCLSLDEVAVELNVDRHTLDVRLGLLDPEDQAEIALAFAYRDEGVA